jgi:hypothetical protein
MKRFIVSGFGAAALLAGSALAAQALPMAPAASEGLVTPVSDGCGAGNFRDWRGFCRYGYGPRRFYGGPPRVVVREVYRPRPYWARPYRAW